MKRPTKQDAMKRPTMQDVRVCDELARAVSALRGFSALLVECKEGSLTDLGLSDVAVLHSILTEKLWSATVSIEMQFLRRETSVEGGVSATTFGGHVRGEP